VLALSNLKPDGISQNASASSFFLPMAFTQGREQEETVMLPIRKHLYAFFAVALVLSGCSAQQATEMPTAAAGDGVVKVKSAYPLDETIARLKQDIAAKGIMFFDQIDQSQLAANADIALRPSTLLIFGNPPLGTQFITANPNAGLDWPVRLLVTQDADGTVWAIYTDFDYIKRRHGIADRDAQFAMASQVIDSITSSVVEP
jgi:uncharacterized protein (DUF302 family)